MTPDRPTMQTRADRSDDAAARVTDAAPAPASEAPLQPGFARARRRALALAGASAIAPGVRAATPGTSDAGPPTRLRTGWILRPDDR